MESSSKGKISIIVPVYKVEDELDRCVQSLIHQTYQNIEILLVDDGSPDQCPAMCDAYAGVHNNIRAFHKENGGLSDARNYGLLHATGEFVLYVDSDDYLELDACKRLISATRDDVQIVVGVCKEIHENDIFYQQHTNIVPGKVYSSREFVMLSIQQFEWYAPAVLNLSRRSFLVDHQLFFKKGYLHEDVEMLPRLFLAADKITYVDYPFYNYIIRDNSITTSDNTPQKREMTLDIYKGWYEMITALDDDEYQSLLYGYLIKLYLKSARSRQIEGWKIPGMNASFALRYAIGFKERLKVLFFTLAPAIYVRL